MKLYLIYLSENILFAYTWDKTALITLLKMCPHLQFDEYDAENIPFKGGILKDAKHVENLVNFYKVQLGYDAYLWKYVQYNRNILKKVDYAFMSEFHKLYQDTLCEEICCDLNDLLNNNRRVK